MKLTVGVIAATVVFAALVIHSTVSQIKDNRLLESIVMLQETNTKLITETNKLIKEVENVKVAIQANINELENRAKGICRITDEKLKPLKDSVKCEE